MVQRSDPRTTHPEDLLIIQQTSPLRVQLSTQLEVRRIIQQTSPRLIQQQALLIHQQLTHRPLQPVGQPILQPIHHLSIQLCHLRVDLHTILHQPLLKFHHYLHLLVQPMNQRKPPLKTLLKILPCGHLPDLPTSQPQLHQKSQLLSQVEGQLITRLTSPPRVLLIIHLEDPLTILLISHHLFLLYIHLLVRHPVPLITQPRHQQRDPHLLPRKSQQICLAGDRLTVQAMPQQENLGG